MTPLAVQCALCLVLLGGCNAAWHTNGLLPPAKDGVNSVCQQLVYQLVTIGPSLMMIVATT